MEAWNAPEGRVAPTRANVGTLLQGFETRLVRMLTFQLDPRLRRRVDPADVLQESFAEVLDRLDEYRASPSMPFYLWVRLITVQKALQVQRRHVRAARRDVRREVSPGGLPADSSSLAVLLVDSGATPSQVADRSEAVERVRIALERLQEDDREVLTLRFFEQLSIEETARAMQLSPSGISKRLARALVRLRHVLPRMEDMPTPT